MNDNEERHTHTHTSKSQYEMNESIGILYLKNNGNWPHDENSGRCDMGMGPVRMNHSVIANVITIQMLAIIENGTKYFSLRIWPRTKHGSTTAAI